tara:strand:- start:338 stop:775 length:438 start_codon:yes stop_codon:yes gene_type:complete
MKIALNQASIGMNLGEVPVGAVITKDNKVISQEHNSPILENDPTAHAEIKALRSASKKLNNYRLNDCDLYVTLEPCLMCLGALIHSRIRRIIIAAEDKKTGVIVNNGSLVNSIFFNHKIEVTTGILAEESSAMLTSFFKERRVKA